MQALCGLNQVLSEVFNEQENDSCMAATQSLNAAKNTVNIINKFEDVINKKNEAPKKSKNKATYDGNFDLLIQDLKKIGLNDLKTDVTKDPEEIVLSDEPAGKNKVLFELTDLKEYLSALSAEIEDLEGGEITISLDTTLSACCIERTQTTIILNSLLSNAFKYSFGEASVCLSVTLVEFEKERWINYTVIDTGIGMTPEQIKNIFLPFYRGNPSGYIPGNGLGMTVTKKNIDDLKGRIDIQSKINEGTTVNVKFKYYPALN